jgi:hypothetical protein
MPLIQRGILSGCGRLPKSEFHYSVGASILCILLEHIDELVETHRYPEC